MYQNVPDNSRPGLGKICLKNSPSVDGPGFYGPHIALITLNNDFKKSRRKSNKPPPISKNMPISFSL